MDISVTINGLTAATAAQLIAQLGGLSAQAFDPAQATIQHAPAAPPPAAPPPAAPMPAVAAPPPPPAAAAPANPMLARVNDQMAAYVKARGATGVADAKRVLAQVGATRLTDANPEGLAWLAQAFADPNYVAP